MNKINYYVDTFPTCTGFHDLKQFRIIHTQLFKHFNFLYFAFKNHLNEFCLKKYIKTRFSLLFNPFCRRSNGCIYVYNTFFTAPIVYTHSTH